MNPDYAELRRLAKEAAEECGPESDWFDPELVESIDPVHSSSKARRFTAAMTPHMAMRLLALAGVPMEDLSQMLVCPRCKVDRKKYECADKSGNCPIVGIAQAKE
jgi:hypothetical protein